MMLSLMLSIVQAHVNCLINCFVITTKCIVNQCLVERTKIALEISNRKGINTEK